MPTALVVDDSKVLRKLLGSMLADWGYTILEAEDGVHALEVLQERSAPEVALLDWNMPRMDGLQLLKALRAQPKFAAMRILMVTTENSMECIMTAVGAGANEYIMKPFDAGCILEKLKMLGLVGAMA